MESKDTFSTSSSIPLKKVYTAEDIAGLDHKRDLGLPGEEPYTRGVYPNMYRERPWLLRQFSGFGLPQETNERLKYEYSLGQTGLSIAFDHVTYYGLDPDDPRAAADVGSSGASVSSLQDMEEAFEGIPIEKVNVAVVATTFVSCPLAAMYFAMAEKRGLDLSQLRGLVQNDILVFTLCGLPIDAIPPRHMIRLNVDLMEWCVQRVPKFHPVSFDALNYRENGINAYQELALQLSNAIAYIEEELKRGRLKIDDFAPRLAFDMAVHRDFFEEIAKFRAARRMWYKLTKERYQAQDQRSLCYRVHAQTAGSTNTYQQPLNNVVRTAYQVLAAAFGGVQSIHANSYDEVHCLPSEQGILLSLRTQQIAQYETGITHVADPLGGSYYLEWLTNEIEKRAWEYLGEIEERGGLIAALESGWLHRELRREMERQQRKIDTGETKVVGANIFQLPEEPYEFSVFRPNPRTAEIQRAKLEKLKRERDNQKVKEALSRLREASLQGENVMPAVMEAVKAYATVGEICNLWRETYSIWRIPIGF